MCRLVRHKNVVQFIGACSKWPQLCIVTELMAGGRCLFFQNLPDLSCAVDLYIIWLVVGIMMGLNHS